MLRCGHESGRDLHRNSQLITYNWLPSVRVTPAIAQYGLGTCQLMWTTFSWLKVIPVMSSVQLEKGTYVFANQLGCCWPQRRCCFCLWLHLLAQHPSTGLPGQLAQRSAVRSAR